MCLAYAKSLKIVVSDPLAGDLSASTTSRFRPACRWKAIRSSTPECRAAWLAAINYRHEGLSGGKLREAEIYDRINSEPRTIEPGTSVQLASLDGAGHRQLAASCTRRALGAGEQRPVAGSDDRRRVGAGHRRAGAILVSGLRPIDSAQGLQHAGDDQQGWLCQPAGDALSARASRWRSAIAAPSRSRRSAVSMSVDRATDKNRADYAGRMRLRGIFQAGRSSRSTIWCGRRAAAAGCRWFTSSPTDATTGIASLAVDGKPRDGWAMADLDALLRPTRRVAQFLSGLERSPRRSRLALHAAGAGQLRALARRSSPTPATSWATGWRCSI